MTKVKKMKALLVGHIYPQIRLPNGEFATFAPRAPDCWVECKGQKLSAKRHPELKEAFAEYDLKPAKGKLVLPDLGEGYWMLIKSLPEDE